MRLGVLVCLLFVALDAHAQDPYWSEKRGNDLSYKYLSGNWHVNCHGNNLSNKNRSCDLRELAGGKTGIGTYATSQQGPIISIMLGHRDRQHFDIETGWKVRQYGVLKITVGGEAYKVKHGDQGGKPKFEGIEAAAIVRAFMAGNYASYEYPGAGSRHFKAQISLIGFTNAWKIAIEYVGFDPLKTTSE